LVAARALPFFAALYDIERDGLIPEAEYPFSIGL
jgi:hypothetical protein